jgi:hypothetical protein
VNLFVAITVYPDDAPDGMGGYQLLLGLQGMRGKYRFDVCSLPCLHGR